MFACHSCDKTFTQIEQLKDHESEHSIPASGSSLPKKVMATLARILKSVWLYWPKTRALHHKMVSIVNLSQW